MRMEKVKQTYSPTNGGFSWEIPNLDVLKMPVRKVKIVSQMLVFHGDKSHGIPIVIYLGTIWKKSPSINPNVVLHLGNAKKYGFPRDPGSPCQMMIGVYFITFETQMIYNIYSFHETILRRCHQKFQVPKMEVLTYI